jgi:hypothetical protein
MAVQFIPAILTAIRAGVPAAKLIAKYGKKAYKTAEAHAFKLSGASLAAHVGLSKLDEKLTDKKKKEKKEQRTESRKAQRGVRSGERGYKGLKQGGSVSKYSTGGGVRKSKYSL